MKSRHLSERTLRVGDAVGHTRISRSLLKRRSLGARVGDLAAGLSMETQPRKLAASKGRRSSTATESTNREASYSMKLGHPRTLIAVPSSGAVRCRRRSPMTAPWRRRR